SAEIAFEVANDYQQRGIGSALTEELLADARAAGITEIRALVSSDNPAAVALLRRTLDALDISLEGPDLWIRTAITRLPRKLATTVTVPVLRGPAATAKILAAIDLLSGGRLLVGLGPGSSARDYELAGVRFEERWKRLDEAVQALRAYWRADDVAFEGAFYSTAGFTLAPTPAQRPGPPIWIGSWGSAAGLRRVARLADGWLASGYNTTPELFAQA